MTGAGEAVYFVPLPKCDDNFFSFTLTDTDYAVRPRVCYVSSRSCFLDRLIRSVSSAAGGGSQWLKGHFTGWLGEDRGR